LNLSVPFLLRTCRCPPHDSRGPCQFPRFARDIFFFPILIVCLGPRKKPFKAPGGSDSDPVTFTPHCVIYKREREPVCAVPALGCLPILIEYHPLDWFNIFRDEPTKGLICRAFHPPLMSSTGSGESYNFFLFLSNMTRFHPMTPRGE